MRAWLYGDAIDGERLRARIDKILHLLIEEECSRVTDQGAAARAISHLVVVRDELELAGRPPGEFVALSRQTADSIINDIGAVARLVREMAEGVS
jgi:hypothetical protein